MVVVIGGGNAMDVDANVNANVNVDGGCLKEKNEL